MHVGINTCKCFEGSILDQKLLVLAPLVTCFCREFGAEISCNDPIFHQKESSSYLAMMNEACIFVTFSYLQ